MIYSKKRSSIQQVGEKMFLNLEESEIEYLTSLQWDDLESHLEKKYGNQFKENFIERLCYVLKKGRKERKRLNLK